MSKQEKNLILDVVTAIKEAHTQQLWGANLGVTPGSWFKTLEYIDIGPMTFATLTALLARGTMALAEAPAPEKYVGNYDFTRVSAREINFLLGPIRANVSYRAKDGFLSIDIVSREDELRASNCTASEVIMNAMATKE